jgi:hypothetical protein
VKAVCDALGNNLEADDLVAWTEVDSGTLIRQHLSEESIKHVKWEDSR